MANTKDYCPQVSPGNPNLTPPSTTEPTLTPQGKIVLTFPYVTPTLTVTLKAPNFNNKHNILLERIFKRSRGGTVIMERDQTDPVTEKLALSIDGITPTEIDSYLTFIKTSLGKEIGLEDYESRQWRGIIVNPDEAVNQQDSCSYSLRLEFQGSLA